MPLGGRPAAEGSGQDALSVPAEDGAPAVLPLENAMPILLVVAPRASVRVARGVRECALPLSYVVGPVALVHVAALAVDEQALAVPPPLDPLPLVPREAARPAEGAKAMADATLDLALVRGTIGPRVLALARHGACRKVAYIRDAGGRPLVRAGAVHGSRTGEVAGIGVARGEGQRDAAAFGGSHDERRQQLLIDVDLLVRGLWHRHSGTAAANHAVNEQQR